MKWLTEILHWICSDEGRPVVRSEHTEGLSDDNH